LVWAELAALVGALGAQVPVPHQLLHDIALDLVRQASARPLKVARDVFVNPLLTRPHKGAECLAGNASNLLDYRALFAPATSGNMTMSFVDGLDTHWGLLFV
jgi:hypothetical protein